MTIPATETDSIGLLANALASGFLLFRQDSFTVTLSSSRQAVLLRKTILP
jgi:hypothetical protein